MVEESLFFPFTSFAKACSKLVSFLACRLKELRRANNHSEEMASKWRGLSQGVAFHYGQKYSRSVEYLEKLASNSFWSNACLMPLPCLSQPVADLQDDQPLVMHPAVLNALAPAMPLRAIFGGNRMV